MKIIKRFIAITGIFALILAVSGCGKYENLEEYYTCGESEKSHIDEIADINADNMTMSISGNDIHYDVVYDKAFDEEIREYASREIEQELETMRPVFAAIAKTIEDEINVKDVKIKLMYQDSSGYVLFEDTISSRE